MGKPVKLMVRDGSKTPAPPAPGWFSAEAREEWQRVAPVLHDRGVLNAATVGALESYCCQTATVRQAQTAIAREGSVLTTPTGSRPHPMIGAMNRASAVVLQLSKRLGLMPADASGKPVRAGDDPYSALGID